MPEAITTQYEDAVAIVTMDDGKANTLTLPRIRALSSALDGIEASGAGAVILEGRTGNFGAGLDLNVWRSLDAEEQHATLLQLGRLALRLFVFPRPVVAAIGGHAIAGGAILALSADIRIASDAEFRIGVTAVAQGIDLPTFGVVIGASSIPSESHAELLLHGLALSPREAHARRVIHALVAPEELQAATRRRATDLARLSGTAYATTKMRLRGAVVQHAHAVLETELVGLALQLSAVAERRAASRMGTL